LKTVSAAEGGDATPPQSVVCHHCASRGGHDDSRRPGSPGTTRYYQLVTEEARRLDGALAGIRADEAAGELPTREAADNRIAVLEADLTSLRLLREEYPSS